MDEGLVKPEENLKPARGEHGRLLPGGPSLNPKGRPKGTTMKEYARQYLLNMTPDEKDAWLSKLSPDIIWRMSEGNPHQSSDVVGEITVAQPLLVALKPNVRHHDSDKTSGADDETDQGDTGRDLGGQDGGDH